MVSIFAGYETTWLPYSARHEQLATEIESSLCKYGESSIGRQLAYAVVGTFGSGKTQLLMQIYKLALRRGLLPMYTLAEHLFGDVLGDTTDRVWLPAQIAELVRDRLARFASAVGTGDENRILQELGDNGSQSIGMVADIVEHVRAGTINCSKPVLLVDELEAQYRSLQARVQADERSPLREWLESDDHLKIVALAPAGIYEMGSADQSRVIRWVLPGVDPAYVRRNSALPSGLANAAWWFSRGKPRQLSKAIDALNRFSTGTWTSEDVLLLCRDGLDRVGQEPSAVDAAELEALEPSEYSSLLRLEPVEVPPARRLVINVGGTKVSAIADKLRLALAGLDGMSATLLAQYTTTVMHALADSNETLSTPVEDLPDLLQMGLDLLIEYEHASPGIAERLSVLLQLYDEVAKPLTYGTLLPLWELRETNEALPISCRKLRQVFPFPIMNPTVKTHIPEDIRRRYEGKGVPVWRWSYGENVVLVFASARDLATFTSTDHFKSEVLPDARIVDCIVPSGGEPLPLDALRQWLVTNGKLRIIDAPPLIDNFLMSAAGEISGDTPGDLELVLSALTADTRDPLTGRKIQVYKRALEDLMSGPGSTAAHLLGPLPADATSVWGTSQIGDHSVAVLGCALAFQTLTEAETQLIASLRECFRGGAEGRGAGGLRPFLPRGGYPSLADDLLPTRRVGRQPGGERQPIQRLRAYFGIKESEIRRLAIILSLDDFRRLHSGEDYSRVLEAIWRATRREYDATDFVQLLDSLLAILAAVDRALQLEELAVSRLRISGINFGEAEDLVRNQAELKQFVDGVEQTKLSRSEGAPLIRAIQAAFMRQVLDKAEPLVRRLEPDVIDARRALDLLPQGGGDLLNNLAEYGRASAFASIDREVVNQAIQEITIFSGSMGVRDVTASANQARQELMDISGRLQRLDRSLQDLEDAISEIRGE